jgi:hypothetical protein
MVSLSGGDRIEAMEKNRCAIDQLAHDRHTLSDVYSSTRRDRKSNIPIRLTHVASETGSRIHGWRPLQRLSVTDRTLLGIFVHIATTRLDSCTS